MMKFDVAKHAENGLHRLLNTATRLFCRKVYADDTPEDGDGEDEAPQVSFEDLISKARKEEKDKLYPQIDKLKKEKKVLTDANNAHLLTISGLQDDVTELKKQIATAGTDDSELVKGLKKQLDDALKIIDGLREDLKNKPEGTEDELRETIRKEVEAEYEVKLYRLNKLQELGDKLLVPEVVTGTTTEEIDASIKAALEQSKKIRERLGVDEDDEEDDETPPPKKKTKAPAKKKEGGEGGGEDDKKKGKPRPNPMNPTAKGASALSGLDANDIRGMSDEDYAAWRKQAGVGVQNRR